MDPSDATMPGALSLFRGASSSVRSCFGDRLVGARNRRIEKRKRVQKQEYLELSSMCWVNLLQQEMKEAANGARLAAGATTPSDMSAAGHDVPVGRAAARSSTKESCVDRSVSACINEGSSGSRKFPLGKVSCYDSCPKFLPVVVVLGIGRLVWYCA